MDIIRPWPRRPDAFGVAPLVMQGILPLFIESVFDFPNEGPVKHPLPLENATPARPLGRALL